MQLNDPQDADNLALKHYKYFLKETAESLGMPVEELQKIEGFQSPDDVNNFIDNLVKKYGVTRESLHGQSKDYLQGKAPQKYLQNGETYNEWELP